MAPAYAPRTPAPSRVNVNINTVLLSAVVLLMGWTVKGVQELKEQSAATSVAISNMQITANAGIKKDELLADAVRENDIEIAKIKQRLGM